MNPLTLRYRLPGLRYSMFILALVLLGSGPTLFIGLQPVHATTYTVTNLNDSRAGSLRQAISDANGHAGADSITFQSSLTGTISLVSDLPDITGDLTITGPGSVHLRINGNNHSPFWVASGVTALFSSFQILNGSNENGGAIYNSGNLTLENIHVELSSATEGGGMYNTGTLTIRSSLVRDNRADMGGGIANYGTLTITDQSKVTQNFGLDYGGGIYNNASSASVLISDSAEVSDNLSAGFHTGQGGGIFNRSGTVTVTDTAKVNDNFGQLTGGGIHNEGVLYVHGGAQIANNTSSDNLGGLGGGIFNSGTATISGGVQFFGNKAVTGSAIFNWAGRITITGSIIHDNLYADEFGAFNRDGSAFAAMGVDAISTISESCIVGNAATAVVSDEDAAITATRNWWGAPDGPGPVGPGTGDTISSGVLFEPFLTEPPAGLNCGIPLPDQPSTADHTRAQAPLCADLDGSTSAVVRADVPGGTVTGGSVFCRIIAENGTFRQSENPAEIGIQSVLDRGVFQAVDVFGLLHDGTAQTYFSTGVEVCLQGSGALLYLDATTAPRVAVELPTWASEDYTCATIPNAGTVVLVSGAPGGVVPPASSGSAVSLSGCMVTTKNLMNLRAGPDPSSAIIRQIPYNVTLTAFARQGDWFQIDYLGTAGWLNTAYVTPDGACGP